MENQMIIKHRLKDNKSTQYKEFETLYAKSFPKYEQRTPQQQNAALDASQYHLELYYKSQIFVGFIAYWQFDTYCYIEHFAIHDHHRGKGYGAQLLNELIQNKQTQIILEIDPIIDEITTARWRFYERCGFLQNSHKHTHPPYRKDQKGHSLIVLSSTKTLTQQQYDTFYNDLHTVIMHF